MQVAQGAPGGGAAGGVTKKRIIATKNPITTHARRMQAPINIPSAKPATAAGPPTNAKNMPKRAMGKPIPKTQVTSLDMSASLESS
jgi:hypothetical protein